MSFSHRRHFRIKYPQGFCSQMIINGKAYQIVDVSISGAKYQSKDTYLPESGSPLVTTIAFRSGPRITIKASVVRTLDSFVMINFDEILPQHVLKNEADLILDQFGEINTDNY